MKAMLILGRVSNLPTVWSNCLAAWLVVGGGGSWGRLGLVCLGAALLYTGGMFLNDAVDVGFDRRFRPERPIVSGLIGVRTVWVLSILWLSLGWLIFAGLGKSAAVVAGILLLVIVVYDVVHKRTTLAPLLMAACRFFLYLAVASAVHQGSSPDLLWRAGALGAYIVGLSYLARGESDGGQWLRWTGVLLFAPALIALGGSTAAPRNLLWVLLMQGAWTLWCLSGRRPKPLAFLPQGVAGLLAGIALVDLVAAAGHGFALAFVGLFVLALLLQRLAPAT